MSKRLLISMLLMLVMGQVWALSTYYVKLKAHESTGHGLVYVSESKENVSEEKYKTGTATLKIEAEDDGEKKTLYAFAMPESDDYLFTGWSWEDGGDIVSRDNPFAVELIARSDSTKYTKDVYANFLEKIECTHAFVKSQGTVTVSDGTNELTAPGKITTKEELTLTASDVDGKDFLGWYYMNNGRKCYFAFEQKVKKIFTDGKAIGADYIDKGVAAYYIKETGEMYTDFNFAVSVAAKCSGTVVVAHDGTLAKGTYTIPENVTLLIPFDSKFTCYKEQVGSEYIRFGVTPHVFKTLTMERGAKLVIKGALSVSAKMIAGSGGKVEVAGGVFTDYGCIDMNDGSEIVLDDKSNLYAWGYIIGSGKVTANRGSTVYEGFQITAFRGGNATSSMIGWSQRVFPINQYFVQNVEVPMTLCYGATEKVVSSIQASETGKEADAKINICDPLVFIGKDGLFELADGTVLTKSYDGRRDRQVYNINGDVVLGHLSLGLLGYSASSADFVMPLTNNLSITLERGTLSYKNAVGIDVLPGVELTIKEGATMKADKGNMYVYDSDDWGEYACYVQFMPTLYAPSRTYTRTSLEDAKIDVQGSLITDKAFIYTTTHNANICCSEGFGKIVLGNGVGVQDSTYQATQVSNSPTVKSIAITPARLYNADGSYTETSNAVAGTVYHYVHGRWQTGEMSSLLGDVNCDGKVDKEDVDALAEILRGEGKEEYDVDAADMDNNGVVTVKDLVKLIELIIGK